MKPLSTRASELCTMKVMELLTTGDVARALKVSDTCVRQLERAGVLPARRTLNRIRVFAAADVERVRVEREQRKAAA